MTDYEYSAEECDFDEIDCDEEGCWVQCGDDWVPLSDVVIDDEGDDDEEIEEIEEQVDEICSKVKGYEDCPEELCGDMCELLAEEELEGVEEDLEYMDEEE